MLFKTHKVIIKFLWNSLCTRWSAAWLLVVIVVVVFRLRATQIVELLFYTMRKKEKQSKEQESDAYLAT